MSKQQMGGDDAGQFYITSNPDKAPRVVIRGGHFSEPPAILIEGVPHENIEILHCWFGVGRSDESVTNDAGKDSSQAK